MNVPSGTVDDVVEWIGGDPARAAAAQLAEDARPRPRAGVLDHIARVAGPVTFRHRDGTVAEVSDPGDVWRYDQHPNWSRL